MAIRDFNKDKPKSDKIIREQVDKKCMLETPSSAVTGAVYLLIKV